MFLERLLFEPMCKRKKWLDEEADLDALMCGSVCLSSNNSTEITFLLIGCDLCSNHSIDVKPL